MHIICYSLLKSGIYEDFQQLSMIFGLLFDNDKASHYISKLEDKFEANTEKQEQVLVKYRDVWHHVDPTVSLDINLLTTDLGKLQD